MKEHDRRLIEKLVGTLERMNLEDYVEHVSNRRRMIFDNLFYGILRGLGFSIGFTVLGAVVIVILQRIVTENLPHIGGFIAEVIHAIEARM